MPPAGIFSRLDTLLLRVRDFERSRAWYENHLGFSPSYVDPQERLVVFELGGTTRLTLWELKRGEALPPPGFAGPFPIFLSDDLVRARERLLDQGVEVEMIQNSSGVSFFGFFDPDGNRLEVCQVWVACKLYFAVQFLIARHLEFTQILYYN
jgi:catechol 2,3-dioxygenase-like lactoylglutathione lyase family enzyme